MTTTAIIFASLSLLISLSTLYLSYLRRPALKAHIGPSVIAYHEKKGFSVTIPTTVANSSPRLGVVRRCALTLTPRSDPQRNYYFVWSSFRKLSADGTKWIQQGTAHVIPVLGRTSVTKNIEFVWPKERASEFEVRPGVYDLRMDLWSDESKPFASVVHELRIDEQQAGQLDDSRSNADQGIVHGIVYLTLDRESNRHNVLTQHELHTLLGKST